MKQLNTLLDWIRFCISELSSTKNEIIYSHGSSDAFGEAHALVLGLLNLPFDLPSEYFNAKLTKKEIEKISKGLLTRINDKKPVAYITNRAMFMGLEFYVDERVLIPRSPIFELIESEFAPYVTNGNYPKRILDLCTGSGCIGIACAYVFPEAQVILSDISEDAIEVANINIEQHDIENQVTAVTSDLFAAFNNSIKDASEHINISDLTKSMVSTDFVPINKNQLHEVTTAQGLRNFCRAYSLSIPSNDLGLEEAKRLTMLNVDIYNNQITNYFANEKFDLIVSNPPYVDLETIESLPDEFKHEPALGLGSGDDGLDCTKQILKHAINYMNPNGLLIVEVGASWDLLEETYPEINFNWHTFAKGGEGVFVMSFDELIDYAKYFK